MIIQGGGASSGSSNNGSMSTVSKAEVVEQDYVGMSEVSSYPTRSKAVEEEDGTELELGLGLSLGPGSKVTASAWGDYCRILTAKDFPPSNVSSSASPNAAATSRARGVVAGTKRAAESDSVAHDAPSTQVVGWPPIRQYRMNSLAHQAKVSAEENIVGSSCVNKSLMKANIINSNDKNNKVQEKGHGHSKFVKVNMDGVPIGRKVDLNAHVSYETLAQALEDMFFRPSSTNTTMRPSGFQEHDVIGEAKRPSKLLDGSSEFVLTYEDREGDWMLVGDVPWGMFLNTVRRLRITRTSEANGLAAPWLQDRSDKQRSKPI